MKLSWCLAVCGAALAAIGCSKSEPKTAAKAEGDESAQKERAPDPEPAAKPGPEAEEREVVNDNDDRGDKVEIEVFGSVKGAPKAGKVVIYAAVGDCLDDSADVLGQVPGGDTFMIEVFAPWGSDLTVCAAVDPGDGAPAVRYGKWKQSLHAEGEGEVVFRDVVIELADGKPHAFPSAAP